MFKNVICWLFTCSLVYRLGKTKVHAYRCNKEVDIGRDVWDHIRTEKATIWNPQTLRSPITLTDELNCTKPETYICEVPPNTVPPEELKICNYRNVNYHEQVYRWVAGRGCLVYTPDFLFVNGENRLDMSKSCRYGSFSAPCLELPKDDGSCGCYPFDPGLPEVLQVVNEAVIPTAQDRWEKCFKTAADCCTNYTGYPDKCQPTFDGWTCWQAADAGSTSQEVCSEFAYSGQGPTCYHYSSKQCYPNATWEVQTDYTSCSIAPRLLNRYRFHIGFLAFSIISCLPAVFIFFFYKRLRITRVALHRNLLIVIIIRNTLVIVSRTEVYIKELMSVGETVLTQHGVACRVLAVAERIAGNAVFTCMLIEGIYLHRLIVAVFRRKLNIKWLYFGGAVIATLPVIAWTVVMWYLNNHSCWVVYTVDHIQWILDAPRLLILVLNTGLFADVLRVLLTKIRNSENIHQLNTAKATLFLMPIFGTQFLLTAFRPSTTNCTGEQIYYFIAYAVEGVQGFLVAMLYCYVNKEVRTLVKATYKKTENAFVSQIRDSNSRAQARPTIDRRMTFSTALSCNTDQNNNSNEANNTIKPETNSKGTEVVTASAPINGNVSTIPKPVNETVENGLSNEGFVNEGCEGSRKTNRLGNGLHVEAVNPLKLNSGKAWSSETDSRNRYLQNALAEETITRL